MSPTAAFGPVQEIRCGSPFDPGTPHISSTDGSAAVGFDSPESQGFCPDLDDPRSVAIALLVAGLMLMFIPLLMRLFATRWPARFPSAPRQSPSETARIRRKTARLRRENKQLRADTELETLRLENEQLRRQAGEPKS